MELDVGPVLAAVAEYWEALLAAVALTCGIVLAADCVASSFGVKRQ